jgi:hypothetical protein
MRSRRLFAVITMIAIASLVCGAVSLGGRSFSVAEASPSVSGASTEVNPVVTGPITGGLFDRPWMSTPFTAADFGYSQTEYFYSGAATAYGATAPAAQYETRMLVYRPVDPAKFSGHVIVEWTNDTFQFDLPADFQWLYQQVFSTGDAYVEITAQQAGVCGLQLSGQLVSVAGISPCVPLSLKGWDPVRYAPLFHPGDTYSYDIFSQGAQAVLHPQGVSPLGELRAKDIIAIGFSQSSIELDQYIKTGADAAATVFDGFIIHGDGHQSSPSAYRVPTMHVLGEESAGPVTSTTGPHHVIWQVAGASHLDHWLSQTTMKWAAAGLLHQAPISRQAEETAEQQDGNYGQEGLSLSPTCLGNDEFPVRYVIDAALTDMEIWLRTGTTAPAAPPMTFTGLHQAIQELPFLDGLDPINLAVKGAETRAVAETFLSPLDLVRDANGNAIGGLRLPTMTVPVASYFGSTCALFGTSGPLLPNQLTTLYPTHADYVAQMVTATQVAIRDRYMTKPDGVDLVQRACGSAIPAWGTAPSAQQPPVCGQLNDVL